MILPFSDSTLGFAGRRHVMRRPLPACFVKQYTFEAIGHGTPRQPLHPGSRRQKSDGTTGKRGSFEADKWEYPWYAAGTAFHTLPIDVDPLAKQQMQSAQGYTASNVRCPLRVNFTT